MIGQYDYEGLVENFLRQEIEWASTAKDRLSFHQNKLYSYDSLLAVIRTKDKEKFLYIDKNTALWSNTSKRHTRILKSINTLPVRMWDMAATPEENLEDKLEELNVIINKHNKARQIRPMYVQLASEKYTEIDQLIAEYNIDKRTKNYKQYKQIPFKLFANKMIKE